MKCVPIALPITAFLVATVCTAPFILSPDLGLFLLSLFVLGPALAVFGVALLGIAVWRHGGRQRRMALLSLGILVGTAAGILAYGPTAGRDLADRLRWMVWSRAYQHELDAQALSGGQLPHLAWNGWGMAGMDTSAYLVRDVTDGLLDRYSNSNDGSLAEIPCPVWHVNRLEATWYVVTTYTNTDWDRCDSR